MAQEDVEIQGEAMNDGGQVFPPSSLPLTIQGRVTGVGREKMDNDSHSQQAPWYT